MQGKDYRPLTERELRVYMALLHDAIDATKHAAAYLRAIEIVAGMEETGLPVDERMRVA